MVLKKVFKTLQLYRTLKNFENFLTNLDFSYPNFSTSLKNSTKILKKKKAFHVRPNVDYTT